MKIGKPTLRQESDQVRIQATIDYCGRQDVLWYAVDKRYRDYLTPERTDGFVIALLPLALKLGEDIQVEGVLSEKLYYNLSHYYIHVLASVSPDFLKVRIHPDSLDGSALPNEGGVLTAFSGGIDSFCNLYDHYYNPLTPPGLRITHFNFNNVGSNGEWDPVQARMLFHTRYSRLKAFPASLGMDFIQVDSNLNNILQMNFEQAYTPRNVSVPLLFQKLFKRFYLASAHEYRDVYVGPAPDPGYHDPIALPLLSTETLECVVTGSQYTRPQKTAIVAEMEAARHYLDVCVSMESNAARNCGRCFKCARTLLTLELLGKIHHFTKVFDMAAWKEVRTRRIIKTLWQRKNTYHAEILEHAELSNYQFPWHYKALANALRIMKGDLPNNTGRFAARSACKP